MPHKDPEAHRAYHAAYREAHRERIRIKNRLYAATQKEQRRLYDAAHKERRRARDNAAYAANPEYFKAKQHAERQRRHEAITARDRAYYALHQEKKRAQQRAARRQRLEAIRLRDRAYYAANRPGKLASKRRHHIAHRAARIAYQRLYARTHHAIVAAIGCRRRARKASAPLNDVTAAERQAVIDAAHGVCVYCPAYNPECKACQTGTHKLTVDHITAYAAGGSNTLHNLIACCRSCNSKKHTGPPPCPVQPLLVTIAPSKKKKVS